MLQKAKAGVLIVLILGLVTSTTVFAGQCDTIRSHILRLHILANSDREQDQILKYQVRDRILQESAGLLDGSSNEQDARIAAQAHIGFFQAAAEDEVRRQGYHYPVAVEVKKTYFNTRQYEAVTMPAGVYDALVITIGEGNGKNWWCVMFPPMCLPAAGQKAELGEVLSREQLQLVSEKPQYEVRFKVVEIFESIKEKLAR